MADLYDIYEHPKEEIKRHKSGVPKKTGRNGRSHRFYSQKDMSILKHDLAAFNSQVNRGETKLRGENRYVCECGCGCVGCFVISSFESQKRPCGEIGSTRQTQNLMSERTYRFDADQGHKL